MAERIEIEEEAVPAADGSWLALVRRMVLAGADVVGLAQNEAETLVQRLVQLGELGEKEGRTLLAELQERQRRFARMGPLFLLERQVALVLHKLNVPTKAEIDRLAEKVDLLGAKVEQLRQLLQDKEGS